MATLTITIPDQHVSRILDAFAQLYGWTSDLGITKAEFARQRVRDYVKDVVIQIEGPAAATAAQQSVNNDVNAIGVS